MAMLPYLTFYSLLRTDRVSLLSSNGNITYLSFDSLIRADRISLLLSNGNVALPNLFPDSI